MFLRLTARSVVKRMGRPGLGRQGKFRRTFSRVVGGTTDSGDRFSRCVLFAGVGMGGLAYSCSDGVDAKESVAFCDGNKISDAGKYFSPNIFVDAIEKALPGLVNIKVAVITGPFSTEAQTMGTGSGFIVSSDGYIITNSHVVESALRFSPNARKFIIQLSDGRVLEAALHSHDKVSDIALLKIKDSKGTVFPTMKLGSSSKLRHGEWVVALGSPVGLCNTATHGIVSSLGRHSSELGMSRESEEYIQTDATINPGNSGGPLVNLDGEVVGINRMVLAGTGAVGGSIGFAIPIDTAWSIVKQLRKSRRVVRPFVGLRFIALNPAVVSREKAMSKTFPHDVHSGVLILQVLPKSPADSAGLQPGDIVVKFEKQTISSTKHFYDALHANILLKKQFDITVLRGDKRMVLKLSPEIKK